MTHINDLVEFYKYVRDSSSIIGLFIQIMMVVFAFLFQELRKDSLCYVYLVNFSNKYAGDFI
jgi:hypothetical protein